MSGCCWSRDKSGTIPAGDSAVLLHTLGVLGTSWNGDSMLVEFAADLAIISLKTKGSFQQTV